MKSIFPVFNFDMQLVAIFDDENKAIEFAKQYESYQVEEWTLNHKANKFNISVCWSDQ